MIYIDDHIDDFDLQEALATVSAQRREQALRYRHERDRRLNVAAYRLLHRALMTEYGINELPQFTYDSNGKPALAGYPDIHFSMSHCRVAVACAVSDRPVGIDIETLDHYSDRDDHRDSSCDEESVHVPPDDCRILESHYPNAAFTRLWTMKESLFKLTGDDCGGDIARMLQESTRYRFTTVNHPQFIVTDCRYR